MMKKIIAVIMCIASVASLAACTSKSVDESGTEYFETPSDAYNAMVEAAQKEDYSEAVMCYNSGASNDDSKDTLNWYFYSLAMNDYKAKGCLGSAFYKLDTKVDKSFRNDDKAYNEILTSMHKFDGVYESAGVGYLYICNGIIFASATKITQQTICTDELAVRDGKYYWAQHSENGNDKLLYTLSMEDSGLIVSAADDAADDSYAGVYSVTQEEMPLLVY